MNTHETDYSLRTAVLAHTNLDYLTFGHGQRSFVILPGLSIHSVMGAAEQLAQAFADFTREYTVYVMDRPAVLEPGCTVRSMARDTALALRSLGVREADVFGASQGGMMAQCIAAEYPELVRRLVLASTLCRTNPVFDEVLQEWLSLAEAAREDALLQGFARRVYSPRTMEQFGEAILEANRGITAQEYRRLLLGIAACRGFDSTGELGRIHAPALVLGALGDRVTTAEGSRELAQGLGCELFLYPETFGHAVYDEAPDFRARIREFFEH